MTRLRLRENRTQENPALCLLATCEKSVDNVSAIVLISQQDKGNEKEEYILKAVRESVAGVNAWVEEMEGSF